MLYHARSLFLPSKSLLKFRPNTYTHFHTQPHFVSSNILPICSSTLSLAQTKQAHALALLSGLLPHSVSVSASLILQYAKFNSPRAFKLLFDHTVGHCRTAFLWNTLIRAYNIVGNNGVVGFDCNVLGVYNLMIRSGVVPDDHTFPFVLKMCYDYRESWKGREVHGVVFKLGFDLDVYVGNTLLLFYGRCGGLRDVERVFDEMLERDVVSWNTVIGVFSGSGLYEKAVMGFREMNLRALCKGNSVTFVSVLPVCGLLGDFVLASQIHCDVVKVGLDRDLMVGNALVDAYGKCGDIDCLMRVFDGMVERNVVSWNAIITSFTYGGHDRDALDIFRLMISEGVKPDGVTISSMLPVLVELNCFAAGKEVHCYSVKLCLNSDIFVANSLIDMYAKSGHPVKAYHVFNKSKSRNVVSWNAIVASYAQNGLEMDAIELVREMQANEEIPNSVTFTNVLPACARVGFLRAGKEIHARSVRTGSSTDLFVSNALIDMYAKCGCLSVAQNVFDNSIRDEVSYNTLIIGYSQLSDCLKAITLFTEMGLIGMKHDSVSYMGALSACANISAAKQGKEIHGLAVRKLFHMHLFVANSLLDFYTKCGRIDLARKVFDHIPIKDVASWNTMILGYGMLGEFDTAINLFEIMKEDGIKCDSVSYIAVLSACSHGGFVEKGKQYFNEIYALGIGPNQTHYACMVDILARAGLMEEAVKFIKSMPLEPDANVWGSLLGACRLHENIELGSWAAENLLKLKPEQPGYYILHSNMYAKAGRWDEADNVRKLMKSRGVKKNPGCSWI
ncbi:pentatricopeptide repeat-containing protein At4g14170 [Daucus carota subsp. sativus]|nr:PREDICTED: pentatricopeptide repeat-containing protein At4g14170-like isoform X1 [Daucus carota subsp. sativus]XP_017227670.1 PREDICTED: pentatricopeptide repeat-containing protein At4g14170-like isoform X2 [Daucus carota subsp. sativus]